MKRRDFVKSVGFGGVLGGLVPAIARGQQVDAVGDLVRPEGGTLEGRAHRAVWGRNGVVATAHELASLAGMRMLMKGGNAIDAAVAASAALNVVEPYMSGIGGWGGYMMIYLAKERKVIGLDGIGMSPAASALGKITEIECDEGYKAPVVPGSLGTWAEALRRFGTMSLGDVFEPAIELAEQGVPLTRYNAQTFAGSAKKLAQFPTSAAIFLPGGKPPREGAILRQQDLARTLRKVARDGSQAFYAGEIAEKIVKFFQQHGGFLTMADMAAYKPRFREPIQTTFQGYTLHGLPPGSCEMTMFQALNIIDRPDLNKTDVWSVDFAHTWLEAMKLAFLDDDRYNTAKDDVEIPLARLISKDYASQQRARIHRGKAARFPGLPLLPIGTTSLATVDRSGNVVAFTQSHVSGFGSGVVAGDTGVLLNNGHRFGFVLDPDHVNSLAGGQIAKGVMCPTLVMKGDKVLMGVGAAGGYTIPQTVGQVITKVLAYGFDIQRAIASPRLILNRGGGRVPIANDEQTYGESSYPEAILAGLEKLGHRLSPPGNGGAVQGVYIDPETGAMAGGSDPRRDGHALAW